MVKVFLDTNILIDWVEKRGKFNPKAFDQEEVYVSPLSLHILMYATKHKVPYQALIDVTEKLQLVPLDEIIIQKSLEAPTADLEDNIQLHSAAEAECDIFLTADKNLLRMRFFGKTQIQSNLAY